MSTNPSTTHNDRVTPRNSHGPRGQNGASSCTPGAGNRDVPPNTTDVGTLLQSQKQQKNIHGKRILEMGEGKPGTSAPSLAKPLATEPEIIGQPHISVSSELERERIQSQAGPSHMESVNQTLESAENIDMEEEDGCSETPQKKPRPSPDVKACEYCPAVIPVRKYWQHVSQHPQAYKHFCQKCSKTFPQKSRLAHHMSTCRFRCDRCNRKFKKKEYLKGHMRDSRRCSSNRPQTEFICDICMITFSSPSVLDEHRFQHMPQSGSAAYQSLTDFCGLCPLGFDAPFKLENHMKTAHP